MKIAITGGTGFVGRHFADLLSGRGHEPVVLSRRTGVALDGVEALARAFAGCDGVAHLAGINCELGDQTYERVHVEGTRNVVAAARSAGIERVTLLSFLRARPDCGSPYHESKFAAEEIVRASGLRYTVLKSGVIYGRGDHLLDHLSHALHTLPIFATVGRNQPQLRPTAVGDVAEILFAALVDGRLATRTVAVVGPDVLTMRELVSRVGDAIGRRPWIVAMPVCFHRMLARFSEMTMRVPLVSRAQVRMLAEGLCEPAPPCDDLPEDLAPRTRFTIKDIRRGLPPPGPFRCDDLRLSGRGGRRRPRPLSYDGGMSARGSRFVQLGLLFLAIVAAMWPVPRNQFINWDDRDQLVLNSDFNPPRVERMIEYWRGPYVGSLYPVSYNVFGLIAAVAPRDGNGELKPAAFHIASIALHAATTLLVWLIVRKLVDRDWPATAGALLFAVHPTQVEAVAWVSGQNTLLVTALSFLAIWLYLIAVESDSRQRRVMLLIVVALAYGLALWSKPAAVVVPLMAGLLDWLLTRRRARDIAVMIVVGLAIAAPVMLITRKLQTVELVTPTPLWSRPIVALDAVAFYLGKLLFPWRLLVDYGRTPEWLIARPLVWTTGLVTISVAAACWLTRRPRPWLIVAFAVFVAALLPVLGLTPFNVQMISTVTDRYLYLAMLGPALAVAFLFRDVNSRTAWTLATIVLIAFTVRSHIRARDWHDEFSLFEPELHKNPRSLAAHQVLGTTYSDLAWRKNSSADYERALYHFSQALETKSDDPRSLTNLGNVFLRTGNFAQAIPPYEASLVRMPRNAVALNNLGVAHENLGHVAEAEQWYRRAIAARLNWPDPQKNLARLLQTRGGGGS